MLIPKRLKYGLQIWHTCSQGQSGGVMHSRERLLVILLFFFPFRTFRTNIKPVQVLTPSGPKNTDPASVTLTYFSRSQTDFCAKNPKLQIHIASLFMIGFQWKFVGMDTYKTPCWWPTFRWRWHTSSGQTPNRPEIFVTGLAKSRHRRITLATWLDGYYQGPLVDRSLVKIDQIFFEILNFEIFENFEIFPLWSSLKHVH